MGNILLTHNGLETNLVPEQDLDECMTDFYLMCTEAVKENDSLLITQFVAGSRFSYGDYFPAFANLRWQEFHSIPSLKGISQRTYQLVTTSFVQEISPKIITGKGEFRNRQEPKGYGGLRHDVMFEKYLHNVNSWEEWHISFLTDNPQFIDWSQSKEGFFANRKKIIEILSREIGDVGIDVPEKEKDIVNVFHEEVMRKKPNGKELEGYIIKIGDEICRTNYYHFEPELSTMEHQEAKSLRHVWSIVKNGKYQFISFDFETGHFEFEDNNGEHLGEKRFDGSPNGDDTVDRSGKHDLKCLDKWRKKFHR